MASFNVDTDRLIASSGEIAGLAAKMNSICAVLEGIQLNSAMGNSNLQRFHEALKNATDEALSEAAKMRTLSGALQTIANQYRKTEADLAGVLSGAEGSGTGVSIFTGGSVLMSQLVTMIQSWLKKKQQESYTATSYAQEIAANAAMRRKLRMTLQDEKYSQENWEKATVEERKQILQDYMDEVIDIYGLKEVNPTIDWQSETYTENTVLFGYYYNRTHTVTLNEQVLTDSVGTWDSYEMLGTVAHELRHAYQYEAIANPSEFLVSQNTINTWSDNLNNYIDSGMSYSGYYNQPVEVDARSFEV